MGLSDTTHVMDIVILLLIIAAGVSIGSFLNVVIYRLPRHQPIMFTRSRCPNCRNQLKWYHNIPLFSFVALLGRCAYCRAPISARYPAVEFLNAGLWAFFYWQFGLTVELAVFSFLGSALLTVFFIDLDFQIIPDRITLPGIALGLAVSLLPGGLSILDSLIGLLAGGGSLYLIALLGDWLFKKESMGGGDIKMMAMLGAFLGWQKVLFIFVAGAAIGLVVSLVLMLVSSRLRKERVVPFGPFLASAAIIAITWGDYLIDLYVSSFLIN
jgi:leader peptidase (prepilin peptidase)/N-methyltransferase